MRRLDLLPSAPFFPTASELHRAAECVAPWALGLPEAEEAPGVWAEFGRRMHGVAEVLATKPKSAPIFCTAEEELIVAMMRVLLAEDWETAKLPTGFYVEQGVAWRPGFPDDEAKFVQREPGERLRGWFSGTVDLAYVRADGVLVVVDWKFGPREHINGEPAQDSCQGFFLALALCTALEIRGSSAGVVVARFERRMVREDGIEVDGHDITQGELDAWAKTLAGLARRIDSAEGASPKLSAACGKCKARAECPAWDALESVAMAELSDVNSDMVNALCRIPQNDAELRALHNAIVAGETLLPEWKKWRDAYVLTHPEGVPIGLGLRLKAIPSKDREVLDTPEALDVIERIAGPGAIEVQRKSSIARIRAAARDSVDKNIKSASDRDKSKKAAEERVFAELVKAGAVIDKGKKLTVRVVRSDEEE